MGPGGQMTHGSFRTPSEAMISPSLPDLPASQHFASAIYRNPLTSDSLLSVLAIFSIISWLSGRTGRALHARATAAARVRIGSAVA